MSFGEAMKDFIWFIETVDIGVDVGNHPRVIHPGRHKPILAQENAEDQAVEGDEMRGETGVAGTQSPRHQGKQEGRIWGGHTVEDGTRPR